MTIEPTPFRMKARDLERVVVTSTHYKPDAHPLVEEFRDTLRALGAEVLADPDGTSRLTETARGADLVIAVGGDGTLLNCARRLVGVHVPVLGVNLGKLGFLADFSAAQVRAYLAGGETECWRLSPKMMLQVMLNGDESERRYALNDVMVSQGVMTRLINIAMWVDDDHATQYRADGVVVSTPVGSTAYSLSLGGPIISQGLRVMVITPIAPHTLTNRPMVIEGGARATFEVQSRVDELALVVDGQERVPLGQGDRFAVTAAPTDFLVVSSGERTYFEVLRRKLNWGTPPNLRDQG